MDNRMHHTSLPRLPFAHARSLLCVSLCLLTGVAATAAPLQQVTLANGRLIELEDDFTWHYVVLAPSNSPTSNAVVTARSAATTQVLADPALLHTAAASGVKVHLLQQVREGDQLGLTVEVTNLASGSVVRVQGRLTLYSVQGAQLSQQETPFWQAEYRLPESYLRQDQTRTFHTIWLPWPSQEPMPLVRLEILGAERRS